MICSLNFKPWTFEFKPASLLMISFQDLESSFLSLFHLFSYDIFAKISNIYKVAHGSTLWWCHFIIAFHKLYCWSIHPLMMQCGIEKGGKICSNLYPFLSHSASVKKYQQWSLLPNSKFKLLSVKLMICDKEPIFEMWWVFHQARVN